MGFSRINYIGLLGFYQTNKLQINKLTYTKDKIYQVVILLYIDIVNMKNPLVIVFFVIVARIQFAIRKAIHLTKLYYQCNCIHVIKSMI